MKRIDTLTPEQKAAMDGWADKWIEIGLRTGDADRPLFEESVRDCYRFAGLPEPKRIVWVPSPIVMQIAAPTAAFLIAMNNSKNVSVAVRGAVSGAVGDAVRGAVSGAVGDAVRDAVGDAVRVAVDGAVSDAVRVAVGDAVDGAVDVARGGATAHSKPPTSR